MISPGASICIPNYNYETYIKESVESALKQTYADLEIIVSDDASSDASIDILNKIDHPKLTKIFQKTNLGRLNNINACLKASTHEYVTLLPSDAKLVPEAITLRMQTLIKHPSVVLVFSGIDLITEEHTETKLPFDKSFICKGSEFLKELLKHNPITTASVLMQRSALEKIGWFNKEVPVTGSRDWLTWLQLCLEGDIAYIPKTLIKEHVHENNITSTYQKGADISEHEYGVLQYFFKHTDAAKYVSLESAIYALHNRSLVRALRQSIELQDTNAANKTLTFTKTLEEEQNIKSIKRHFIQLVVNTPGLPTVLRYIPKKQLLNIRSILFHQSSPKQPVC